MPKFVDKASRREQILTVYLDLVYREGLAGASTRALAKDLDMAVGGLWLYFDSVEDLRLAAFERTWLTTTRALDVQRDEATNGLTGLTTSLAWLLPIHKDSLREAKLSMAFLETPGARDRIYAAQLQLEDRWREDFAWQISRAQEQGDLRTEITANDLAELLISVVIGLQMEFAIGSPRGQAIRMWELASSCIVPWLTGRSPLPQPAWFALAAAE